MATVLMGDVLAGTLIGSPVMPDMATIIIGVGDVSDDERYVSVSTLGITVPHGCLDVRGRHWRRSMDMKLLWQA